MVSQIWLSTEFGEFDALDEILVEMLQQSFIEDNIKDDL
jgi:hypothetical protein